MLLLSAALVACGPKKPGIAHVHPSSDAGTDVDANTLSDASIEDADAITDANSTDAGLTDAQAANFQTFLAAVQTELTRAGSAGASVAVVLNGHDIYASGVGEKNTTTHELVTTNTLFRVASMSKMITAATAMSLVDDGLLDLNIPITHYLPWFALSPGFDASSITVGELLSHSAGFPCDTISLCYGTETRTEFFMANPQPLWAPPGAVWDYSNAGFDVASLALSAASGTDEAAFEQLVHDRIFMKAGMTHATYDAYAALMLDHAIGYETANGSTTAVDLWFDGCEILEPAGGIMATATDYANFAIMLMDHGGTTLSPSSVSALETGRITTGAFGDQQYGYGLFTQTVPFGPHRTIWHDGSLNGYTSEMFVVPDFGFAVVALVNSRSGRNVPDSIVSDAVGIFVPQMRVPPTLATPSSEWTKYVGTYDDNYGRLGTGIVITQGQNDAGMPVLWMSAPNATDGRGAAAPVSSELDQSAINTFGMRALGTTAQFAVPDGGVMTYMSTRLGIGVRR